MPGSGVQRAMRAWLEPSRSTDFGISTGDLVLSDFSAQLSVFNLYTKTCLAIVIADAIEAAAKINPFSIVGFQDIIAGFIGNESQASIRVAAEANRDFERPRENRVAKDLEQRFITNIRGNPGGISLQSYHFAVIASIDQQAKVLVDFFYGQIDPPGQCQVFSQVKPHL